MFQISCLRPDYQQPVRFHALHGETIGVHGGFTESVYVLILDAGNFNRLVASDPTYKAAHVSVGGQHWFTWTSPYAGQWVLVVWNYQPPGTVKMPAIGTLSVESVALSPDVSMSALSGAIGGAVLGSAVAGWVGAVIGGLAGAAIGASSK